MNIHMNEGTPAKTYLEAWQTSCFDPLRRVLYIRNGDSWDKIKGKALEDHEVPELSIDTCAMTFGRNPCIRGYGSDVTRFPGYFAFPNVIDHSDDRVIDIVFIRETL